MLLILHMKQNDRYIKRCEIFFIVHNALQGMKNLEINLENSSCIWNSSNLWYPVFSLGVVDAEMGYSQNSSKYPKFFKILEREAGMLYMVINMPQPTDPMQSTTGCGVFCWWKACEKGKLITSGTYLPEQQQQRRRFVYDGRGMDP